MTSVDNFAIKTVITNNGAEAVSLLNDPNSILTPEWKTNTFGIVGPNGTPAKFDGVKASFPIYELKRALLKISGTFR